MPLENATLRQLRVFVALVRTGTVTAAAQAMHVTPPAITMQMKDLQALLGVVLVERSPRGLVVTEAGREVLLAIERIEHILADCSEQLGAQHRADVGTVSVGLISTAKYVLPRALATFRGLHPGIDMKLSVGNREQIIHGLQNYDLDLAVMGRPPQNFAVEAEPIGPHPLVVVAHPDHPMARRRRIAPVELEAETFLVREPGSGTRLAMERFFANQALGPRIGMQIDSNETLKQAVIAGLGLAFISAHTIETDLNVGHLVVLDVVGLPILREWFLVHLTERRLTPVAATLRRFIVAETGRFLPQTPMPGRRKLALAGRPKRSVARRPSSGP